MTCSRRGFLNRRSYVRFVSGALETKAIRKHAWCPSDQLGDQALRVARVWRGYAQIDDAGDLVADSWGAPCLSVFKKTDFWAREYAKVELRIVAEIEVREVKRKKVKRAAR